MIGNPPTHLPDQVGMPAMERMLVWVSFGLPRAWVEERILPACGRFSQYLDQGEAPATWRALERGDGDWDILFLGSEAGLAQETGSIEAMVRRVSRVRTLDCVIAVTAAATAERQLSLMRAGAADVVAAEASAAQIERTLERLIGLLQTRRSQSEQDKLRVINQLTISVNHEINNPLTGLMGTAELLLMEDKNLSEKVRRDLQTIIKQCHRIQEVTARLKTLNHLRTVPYGSHDQMLDLVGEIQTGPAGRTGGAGQAQFLPTPTILVVDDNPLITDLIARMFEQRFTIDAAASASEALAKIEREAYDVVLIDLILPEMNGLELYRAIQRVRPGQKALLTTAYEGDARVEQAIAEGAAGCIYKPFQLEEMEAALSNALKGKG